MSEQPPSSRWLHFSDEEFRRATPSCSLSDMSPDFMDRLESARVAAGVPFVINSAYRSVSYEKKKKRSGRSMHCLGRAVDIKCVDSGTRYRILHALFDAGFHGFGIDSTYIHVDDRESCLFWTY